MVKFHSLPEEEILMRVAMLEAKYRIAVREVDDVRPGPDDLLIKTRFAGVCGSDLHAFKGLHPFRNPPVILGHELSGTVAGMGDEVRGFRHGDRVTVMPLLACKNCLQCQLGNENICLNKRVPGIKGWLGTFAQYFLSKPSITYKLGENTGLDVGALAEPLAVGIHSVFQRGRVEAGSRVLILGAGTIGILTAVAAKMAGAKEIVVTDLFEFNLGVTRELCGAQSYNAKTERLEEIILEEFPQKFDVAFLCSGAPKTVAQAFLLTRRGGRIVVTGLVLTPVPTDLTAVSLNEFEIIGSQVYGHEDFRKAVEWIESGTFAFEKLITHILPIEKAEYALNLLDQHKEDVAKILLDVNA
jgi:2-desacetyl-2-hydroxyethyl bacteriochlorophyllide A dehydrogenase